MVYMERIFMFNVRMLKESELTIWIMFVRWNAIDEDLATSEEYVCKTL